MREVLMKNRFMTVMVACIVACAAVFSVNPLTAAAEEEPVVEETDEAEIEIAPAEEPVPVSEAVIDEPATEPVEDAAEVGLTEELTPNEEAPASKFADLQFGDDYVVEDEPHKGPFGRRR